MCWKVSVLKTTVLFICDHLLGTLKDFDFIIVILIWFWLMMMPGVNYVIYGCSFTKTTPGVSLYLSFTREENITAVITQERVIDDNFEKVN